MMPAVVEWGPKAAVEMFDLQAEQDSALLAASRTA
jgi:hypothetical protein